MSRTLVGVLAQNRQGVFFQYDHGYLSRHPSLSPFTWATGRDKPVPYGNSSGSWVTLGTRRAI